MAATMADRAYLVCATPRSGSTLVCQALRKTGVAGRPEEYFEALLHSGRPRRPEEYFVGLEDKSIRDHLGERNIGDDPLPRSPLWSRTAYDRYLEWVLETGTTPNGVFAAKLMWGYRGRLRQPAAQRASLQRPGAGRAAARGLPRSHIRTRGARQQDPSGGLVVEGRADDELARGERQARRSLRWAGRLRRVASLQELPRRTTARSCASTIARSRTCSTRS